MFKKIILKNGLRVIAVPQPRAQAVTILVLAGTGSEYEEKEISGISHFLEHMFFKGTLKRPNTIAIAESLDRVGGSYNAFTGEEYTGYYAKVNATHFDLALDWVSDIFLNSKLEAEEIEREKGVIIEEINMYYDNPSSHVQTLWRELLYGDQPAGWNIAGTKGTVSAITREKLSAYMNSQYTPSNTIVCLAGNFKSSAAMEKIKVKFSKMKNSQFREKQKTVEIQTKPECILQERKTDQTHLCLGVRAYSIFHPHKYALEILGVILGGMMSSRLFVKVRERLGLAYHISTDVSSETDSGFLATQAGLNNNNVEKAIAIILEEYKKMSLEKISAGELEKAKEYLKGKMALGLELSDAKASFFGMQELLEKEILTPGQICAKIDKVRREDVLKVAKDIFKPEKLNLAIIGPFGDKSKFQEMLKF